MALRSLRFPLPHAQSTIGCRFEQRDEIRHVGREIGSCQPGINRRLKFRVGGDAHVVRSHFQSGSVIILRVANSQNSGPARCSPVSISHCSMMTLGMLATCRNAFRFLRLVLQPLVVLDDGLTVLHAQDREYPFRPILHQTGRYFAH